MQQIGLKLWSTNHHYFEEAKRLWDAGFYDFIELTAVTDSYESHASLWKTLDIPYVIHGPTYAQGLSLAHRDKEVENRERIEEVQRFADLLNASIIILHPGVEGDLKETARQLNLIGDSRVAIENKPYVVTGDLVCNGYLPEHLLYLKEKCGVKTCFDVGHALCAANSLKREPDPFIHQFLELGPEIYHLMDGIREGVYDVHLNLGRGEFDLEKIISLYPDECLITLETEKKSCDDLICFEEDVNYFRGALSNIHAH